ncbi:hypothetical protein [Okeania hirsuta]|nr:hypothetical protein [Okeania hirsuta]
MKRRNLISYATVAGTSAVALPALSQTEPQQIKWKFFRLLLMKLI